MSTHPVELSALLTSLRPSVIESTLLLTEMIKSGKNEITLDDSNSRNIVALLMFDHLVTESVGYSYSDDFKFEEPGTIYLINQDRKKVIKNIDFMLDYMNYRIENPIDLADC